MKEQDNPYEFWIAGLEGQQPQPQPAPQEQTPAREKDERVELTGRVGTPPTFKTTESGWDVLSFRLAVHPEEGKTEWHSVVAFKDTATRLRDSLQKGEEVRVIGFKGENRRNYIDRKTGQERTHVERFIRAVAVVHPRGPRG